VVGYEDDESQELLDDGGRNRCNVSTALRLPRGEEILKEGAEYGRERTRQ
jgi:hypothetical protein